MRKALMDESTPTAGGTLRGRRIASTALLVLLTGGLLAVARPGYAQLYPREVHYLPSAHQPPGYVAAAQHMRGGPVAGYMQPVEISVPSGALVSPAQADGFLEPQADKLHVALMVGQLYWFRVGNIPFHEGQEVYPTIEMINRTYPPIGQKLRFPLPVAFTQEDLELALNGNLVTRVIYIEDPRTALPAPQQPGEQRVLDVTSADDPLYVADRMGRPIAIVRMGSRVPEIDPATGQCLFPTPPLIPYTPPPVRTIQPRDELLRGLEQEMEQRDYPRIPLDSPAPPGLLP